ncbi:hypothetical protein D3C86_1683560 [compost metagenome]
MDVSSSMLAAVSTTAADCCSVRDDKSILPAAISVDERATLSTPSRTSLIMFFRLSFMVDTACISNPGSSRRVLVSVLVRSPLAICSATRNVSISGRVIERVIIIASKIPKAIPMAATILICSRTLLTVSPTFCCCLVNIDWIDCVKTTALPVKVVESVDCSVQTAL